MGHISISAPSSVDILPTSKLSTPDAVPIVSSDSGNFFQSSNVIRKIQLNKGCFGREVSWCSNLSLNDWKTNLIKINGKGELCYSPFTSNISYLHPIGDSFPTQSSTRAPITQPVSTVLIKHLQNCELQLIDDPTNKHKLPTIQVETYFNTLFLRTPSNEIYLELFSALLFWKSLKENNIFNKLSIVKPIFPHVPNPTNLIVCQFNIFGPIPKNKNVHLLSHVPEPPLPTDVDNISHEEGWFSAMGMLKSDGILDLLLQSDGSLIYSIDIKKVLRSEIQILDSSLLQNDNYLFVGLLPELRKQLRISKNETIFENDNSVKKISASLQRIFLQFPLRIDLEDWFVALNTFATMEVLSLIGIDKSNEIKVSNRFKLSLLEATLKGIGMNTIVTDPEEKPISFYAEISIWNNVWAKTSIVTGTYSPFWREEFNFNFHVKIDLLRIGIKQCVNGASYSTDDKLLSYIEITQDMINDVNLNKETRLPIFLLNNKHIQLGNICIKVISSLNFVLPSINFITYEKILGNFDLSKMTEYVYDTAISDDLKLEDLSMVFLDVFQAIHRENDWFQALIDKELSKIDDSLLRNSNKNMSSTHIYNSLFRGNSILTKSIEKYYYRIGQEYLDKSIGYVLRKIVEHEESCEIDPNRVRESDPDLKQQILKENQERLLVWANGLWKTIYTTSNDLPKGIKSQLKTFRKKLEIICNDTDFKNVLNSISGFLFLRFFCPVILNPKLFNFVENHPNEQIRRTLTLLTKILMNLSTLTLFGPKEPWMNCMNYFIEDHRIELLDYMDKVTEKKLDFSIKVLKLSSSVPRPKLDMNLDIIKELPTNPYLIDKYLRETELVNAFATFQKKIKEKGHTRNVSIDQIFKDIQNQSTVPTKSRNINIGELEFEKVTENNAEVFGNDLLKFLEDDDSTSSGREQKLMNISPAESENLVRQLEQESSLLYHRIKHLTTVLADYEVPSEIILGKAEYATFLVESVFYHKNKVIELDFNNMFATKDGLVRLFQNDDTVSDFFGTNQTQNEYNGMIHITSSVDSSNLPRKSNPKTSRLPKIIRISTVDDAKSSKIGTKLASWFKK